MSVEAGYVVREEFKLYCVRVGQFDFLWQWREQIERQSLQERHVVKGLAGQDVL